MTVYADVLLVINLFVNFALLSCAGGIMKIPTSGLRMFLGAAVGSVYGLVIFLPEIPVPAEILARAAASALIVFCAFGYVGARRFARCLFTFLAVSFSFGGIMLVLWLTFSPANMLYSNGVVYFDISLGVLAVSTVICYAAVSLASKLISRRAPKESIAFVTVHASGKAVKTNALIDTGNSLKESFSNFPVCVGEAAVLKTVMPAAVDACLKGGIPEAGAEVRMVIHSTVSGTGIMPAFRPDYIEVKTAGRTVRTDRIYIAVTDKSIAGGEYGMILNPEIFEKENIYAETVQKA